MSMFNVADFMANLSLYFSVSRFNEQRIEINVAPDRLILCSNINILFKIIRFEIIVIMMLKQKSPDLSNR
ncbi:hypothetical protein I871_00260 [Borrelia miyamotoi LB-2001]|uniref:hypothetical protein n=2 Tax=Borrelia miyamotoi TaxID=47466 RepID=UPI00038815CC|nr:hypothetical protein [Borrelia miyamotoi]AGT27054.1 hypothetical protein I871_00260 [Borrelia miyamotoi LB-2001]AJA58264.1 hypothetical protein RJ61_00240 [Borrelia miyamotoi]AOW95340.1 hypothetical protein AXH25_00245 [Borrelia miyamotoi]WAZ85584.1 hypothetical protein O5400_04075 [Borrelia miyamotoi]WAZ93945.1 hypothetical protein O5399_04080 [Borrelia miyamotoi]